MIYDSEVEILAYTYVFVKKERTSTVFGPSPLDTKFKKYGVGDSRLPNDIRHTTITISTIPKNGG